MSSENNSSKNSNERTRALQERMREFILTRLGDSNDPSAMPQQPSPEKGDGTREDMPNSKLDENAEQRHKKIAKLNRWVIGIALIGLIGILVEQKEIRGFFYNLLYSVFNNNSYINEVKFDTFDGTLKISKVSTTTNGWKKQRIWLITKKYENNSERELTISGISSEDKICADDDGEIDVQIKIGENVHTIPMQLSKNEKSLIFKYPEKWIKKMNNTNRIDIRVDDNCGTQTDFTFRIRPNRNGTYLQ